MLKGSLGFSWCCSKYPVAPRTAVRQGSSMCSGPQVFRKEGEPRGTGDSLGRNSLGDVCEEVHEETCWGEAAGETHGDRVLWRQVGLWACGDTCRGCARCWWRHAEKHWWGKRDSWDAQGESPTQGWWDCRKRHEGDTHRSPQPSSLITHHTAVTAALTHLTFLPVYPLRQQCYVTFKSVWD